MKQGLNLSLLGIRAFLIRVTKSLFTVFGLTTIYYSAFSRAFRNEHRTVLTGIDMFLGAEKRKDNVYFLRRNIHRLEKGLVMSPRRPIFALDYIFDTVKTYCTLSNEENGHEVELIDWAHDVLEKYFDIVSPNPVVDAARHLFKSNSDCLQRETRAIRIPYQHQDLPTLSVTYDELRALARRRRSVRNYVDVAVSRDFIDRAIEIAALSPSACNRQPFEFRVFDEPSLVRRIMSVPGGTVGWASSVPVVLVVIGHLRAFSEERDRHLIYIDSSLAVMSLMLALETLGLSSCAINFPDIREKNEEITGLLHLGSDELVTMIVSIGFANDSGLIPFSQKKGIDALRSYNKIT